MDKDRFEIRPAGWIKPEYYILDAVNCKYLHKDGVLRPYYPGQSPWLTYQEAKQFLDNYLKVNKMCKYYNRIDDYVIRLEPLSKFWYILRKNSDKYLWNDGKLHPYTNYGGCMNGNADFHGCWNSKQEAENFLKEYCSMSNYAMIEGQRVELSNETVESLKKALIPEETYAVGDVLQWRHHKVILVQFPRRGKVGMVRLTGGKGNKGCVWAGMSVEVKNAYQITKEELKVLSDGDWEKVS